MFAVDGKKSPFLADLTGNFRVVVVVSAACHVWCVILKSLASEGSQIMGNYSITKLVFVIIGVLNYLLYEIVKVSPHLLKYQRCF